MAYQGRRGGYSFLKSVSFAVSGIRFSFKEKHIRIHYCISVLVLIAGLYVRLSSMEWLFVLSCIGGVIAFEMLNTAIEKTVDLVTEEYHFLAKQAKDISAGAVLVYSIYSVVVGAVIFGPKLWTLF